MGKGRSGLKDECRSLGENSFRGRDDAAYNFAFRVPADNLRSIAGGREMPDLRSVAQQLRFRAERGARREDLELELEGESTLSRLERAILETYVWALFRVVAWVPEGRDEPGRGGEQSDSGP